jgi:putative transcriptional regulator
MVATYHPDTELLTAFSAGSMPLSQALCVSAHLEMCPDCQNSLRNLNKLGAHVFNKMKPSKVSDDLKESVFSKLGDTAIQNPASVIQDVNKARPVDSGVPKCLNQFIDGDYDSLSWHWVSPSIRQANLCVDGNGARVALLRIKPGGKASHHTHMGEEITMVLKGAFSDESGIFQQGDFVLRGSNDKHRPMATKDSECICLTVLDAPIQFTGYFTRWLNPLLRLGQPHSKDFH